LPWIFWAEITADPSPVSFLSFTFLHSLLPPSLMCCILSGYRVFLLSISLRNLKTLEKNRRISFPLNIQVIRDQHCDMASFDLIRKKWSIKFICFNYDKCWLFRISYLQESDCSDSFGWFLPGMLTTALFRCLQEMRKKRRSSGLHVSSCHPLWCRKCWVTIPQTPIASQLIALLFGN